MDEKPPPYSPPQGPFPPYPPTSTPSQPPYYQPPPPPPPPPHPQPQPGFHAVPEAALPSYGSTVYIQQQPAPTTQVIFVGGCPACRVGVLEDDFTCLGVLFAILFFPIGILCCLALRQRRCPNCGAIFG